MLKISDVYFVLPGVTAISDKVGNAIFRIFKCNKDLSYGCVELLMTDSLLFVCQRK